MSEQLVMSYYVEVAIGTSDSVILPAENHRRGIYIISCGAGSFYFAFGHAAVVGTSIRVTNGQIGMWFMRDDLGPLIDTEIHAIAAATQAAGIIVSKFA